MDLLDAARLTRCRLTGSIASSIISPASPIIAREFGVSQETVVLNVSLYVLGFAVGPSMWVSLERTFRVEDVAANDYDRDPSVKSMAANGVCFQQSLFWAFSA